jgi:parvulin-like peptidyl-prolyl isomerase
MKVVRVVLILFAIGVLCVFGALMNFSSRSGSQPGGGDWVVLGQGSTGAGAKTPTGAPQAKKDPIVAKVNGEAIHESDLALDLPKDSFGIASDDIRDTRLRRAIETLTVRQFLASKKIQVPESELDKEIQNLRENPPTAGCACCRFPSLEAFMQANFYDLKELRAVIAANLGLQKYLLAQWDKEMPPGEKRNKTLKDERHRFEQDYIKASHIFFNTFQNPLFGDKPDEVRKTLAAKAQAAWKRIQNGEKFEAVAKEVSEDAVSRPKGGELGCIPPDSFGKEFDAAFATLKTGEYSKPVESPWGFHIIRREAFTDEDVAGLLKDEFLDTKHADVLNEIHANAKVEQPGQP